MYSKSAAFVSLSTTVVFISWTPDPVLVYLQVTAFAPCHLAVMTKCSASYVPNPRLKNITACDF